LEINHNEETDTLRMVFVRYDPNEHLKPFNQYLGHGIFVSRTRNRRTDKDEFLEARIPNLDRTYLAVLVKLDTLWELEREWLHNSGLPFDAIKYLASLRAAKKMRV
jgi:hypothetical protein